MENIGIRIKNIRNILKMSQEEFAKGLNVTKQAISNIENTKSAPGIALLDKLLQKYEVNLNYVISGIGDIFIKQEKSNEALKSSLMKDFEAILEARGLN